MSLLGFGKCSNVMVSRGDSRKRTQENSETSSPQYDFTGERTLRVFLSLWASWQHFAHVAIPMTAVACIQCAIWPAFPSFPSTPTQRFLPSCTSEALAVMSRKQDPPWGAPPSTPPIVHDLLLARNEWHFSELAQEFLLINKCNSQREKQST